MTRLQIALDGGLETALDLLDAVHPYVDIAEIGTPLVYREGMRAVRRIRQAHPRLPLVADLKIMDAGELEAGIAFAAGADIATVMALADDATIGGAMKAARRQGKRIMIDMMGLDLPLDRARGLPRLGRATLCLHTASDRRACKASPYADLARLRAELPDASLAIAGGVTLSALEHILPHAPQVVIVGGGITGAEDPRRAARDFHERIRAHARD